MIQLDVNILIYAYRADSPQHALYRPYLEQLVNSDRPFGVPEMVLSSLVRITTQSFQKRPSPVEDALAFCAGLRASPKCHVLVPSTAHWEIFAELCRRVNAKGTLVADAYLAAFAIDRGDEWVTADRDFIKFPGLTWRHPLEDHAITNPR